MSKSNPHTRTIPKKPTPKEVTMKLRFFLLYQSAKIPLIPENISFSIYLIIQLLLSCYSHQSVLFQQVHHHVSVRHLREQRLGGSSGILGGVLQQRAKSTHLRLLQSWLPGRVQKDVEELLRCPTSGSRPTSSS